MIGYRLTYFFILYLFLAPGLVGKGTQYASIEQMVIQRVSYGIILLIFLVVFLGPTRKPIQNRSPFHLPIFLPLLCIFGTTGLSAIGNSITPIGLVLGLLDYLRYPMLAVALVGLSTERHYKLLKLFFWMTAIQVPIAIAQYFIGGVATDTNSGTLGFGGQDSFAIILSYYLYLQLATSHSRAKKLCTAIGVWGVAALGDVAFLYFTPLVILILYYGFRGLQPKIVKLFLWGVSGVVVLISISLIYQNYLIGKLSKGTHDLFARDTDFFTAFINANGRLRINQISLDLILRSWSYIINGMGINAFYKGRVGILAGNPLADENVLYTITGTSDYSLGGIQFVRVFGETGLLGISAHLLLLITIWNLTKRYEKCELSMEARQWVTAFKGMFFFYVIIGPLYCETWRLDLPALPIWLFVSMMMTVVLKQERVRQNSTLSVSRDNRTASPESGLPSTERRGFSEANIH